MKLKVIKILDTLSAFYKALLFGIKFALQTEIRAFGNTKLQGISYYEIIDQWVNCFFKNQYVIILTNVRVETKNIAFWAKLPNNYKIQFVEDVIILRCKDKSEIEMLVRNIEEEFAEAIGYANGTRCITNIDSKEVW